MQGLKDWLLEGIRQTNDRSYRSLNRESTVTEEERRVILRRQQDPRWTLDRGAGYYSTERVKKKLPCLVQTGKHAGRSRVRYVGVDFQTFWSHFLRRDFFTTAVNASLYKLVAILVVSYYSMLLAWSTTYYIIWRWNHSCFFGFEGFRSAFMYATETQQTIGYGARATGECWAAAVLVSIHSLQAVLLDSVILGIVFSRISHPKQRSRTVLISDCACIARRDGQLKFMFRIADIQRRSVVDPRVKVVLYTWGEGRRTAEGELIPVMAQEMSVALDRTLLLPTTAEHHIDEASPLFGHTLQSLEALSAEIVVTFEASSELGDTFMARQSYLPTEIHWGHTFANILRQAPGAGNVRPGHFGDGTQHEVDLSRFHDVEPQPGLGDELFQPLRLSRRVVSGGQGYVVPGRLLAENTLVLSEDAVVGCRNGRHYLMFRLGDSFPGQVLNVQVTAHLYRWTAGCTAEGELLPYEEHPLELEPKDLLLRYPVTLTHALDEDSPIAHWATQKGLRQDADAEVVVVARGKLLSRQEVVTRTRSYSVLGDVKWGHAFRPVVVPGGGSLPGSSAASGSGQPSLSSKLGTTVDWSQFHATSPITMPPPPPVATSPQYGSPRQSSAGGAAGSVAVVPDPAAAHPYGSTGSRNGRRLPSAGVHVHPPGHVPHGTSRMGHARRPSSRSSPARSHDGGTRSGTSTPPLPHAPGSPTKPPVYQSPTKQPPQQLQQTATGMPNAHGGQQQPPTSQTRGHQDHHHQTAAQDIRTRGHRTPGTGDRTPVGGAPFGSMFTAPGASVAAAAAAVLRRRTDEDADSPSSTANTTAGSVYMGVAPPPAAQLPRRPSMHTGLGRGASDGDGGRDGVDKSWKQTRSLFAALEGIQAYMEEQQQQQQQQEEQEQQPLLGYEVARDAAGPTGADAV